MNKKTISLIGNPNTGKTTVFNALTGSHQKVGNWPGVTVDKKTGEYYYNNKKISVVDLPGTYAIEFNSLDISEDELITRKYVIEDEESILINIIDASNLQRSLYLTFQLLELKRPFIIVLNMMDVAKNQGISIDVETLQQTLGCTIIPVSANKGKGIKDLKTEINHHDNTALPTPKISTLTIEVEEIISHFLDKLHANSPLHQLSKLALLEILANSNQVPNLSPSETQLLRDTQQKLSALVEGAGSDIAIASSRYEVIDQLSKKVITENGLASSALTEKLDKIALGRWSGIPLFLLVMFLMFQFAINIGTSFNDLFEISFQAIFVDGFRIVLESWNSPEWLITILANGIGDGIKTVASFIPVIFFMFFFLSFLEDSGYLARAAMVVDRGMRKIGLPGKAFIPMAVGFGCNVPAIMGTRTLENSNDRLLSISMVPFMSCSARLPIYALFVAIFFPLSGGFIVYTLYLFGIFIAILTGFLFKKALLADQLTPFIMELPLYHLPTFKGLMLSTWQRLKAFIGKAGKAIIIVVAILSILNSIGKDGSFSHTDTNDSFLAATAQTLTPIFEPMGITQENWPATVGIITGLLAKETVIATLNSLYQQMSGDQVDGDSETFSLTASFKEAIDTTIGNLKELPQKLLDPLAISSSLAGGNIDTVRENENVSQKAESKIKDLFPNNTAVMSYLIFILLYTPCVAAIGAIYRETNSWQWTFLISFWTFLVAWICAVAYYQCSILFSFNAPKSAILWLITLPILIIIFYYSLKRHGKILIKNTPVKN